MSDYETDIYAWSRKQGALLRRLAAGERVNDAGLDWPNIAEEIESVGRSERSSLEAFVASIIEHLIKLEASPARDPRAGWRTTVRRSRIRIRRLLKDNPSLRQELDGIVANEMETGRNLAEIALDSYGETPLIAPRQFNYSSDEVLGDWFPDEPQ